MFTASIEDVGVYYQDTGSGLFKATEVWKKAREAEAASSGEEEGSGGTGGGQSSRKRSFSGRNEILAANQDTLEVGSPVFFRVKCMTHSKGAMTMFGSFA